MICSACRNLPSFSRNPFIWRTVLHGSWYFGLGNIFNCSKENEKAIQSPNCLTITAGNMGVNMPSYPPHQNFCYCSVQVPPWENGGGPWCDGFGGDHSQWAGRLVCLTGEQLNWDAQPRSSPRLLKPSFLRKFIEMKSWGDVLSYKQGSGEGGLEHHFSPFRF